MYNGIGLETPRGSGTNGYVQRNLAFVRNRKEQVDYKDDEGLKDWELQLTRRANPELIEHERKRKVELKCAEMHELMEEQGYGEEEIESKVCQFRKMLLEKLKAGNSVDDLEKDKNGKVMNEGGHMKIEAAEEKNRKLREAFGIGEFDRKALKEKRETERVQLEAECKKEYVTLSDDEEDAAGRVASVVANPTAAAAPTAEKVKKSKRKETNEDESAPKKKKKDKSTRSPSDKEKKKKKKKRKHGSREREHRRDKDRR